MNFKAELKQRTEQVEMLLAGYLPDEEGYRGRVAQDLHYSVQEVGKRLRTLLMAESAAIFT